MHKFTRKLIFLLMLPMLVLMGALKVKPIDNAVTKWNENASRAGPEFAANAEAAAEDWSRNTQAASDNYHMSVTAAGIKERFRRGVAKAGASKFARKIREVAQTRYSTGISAAQTDYRQGAEPYFSILAGLSLSPRKPRGDPANYRRVDEVGKALHAKRLAMLGGGGG